MLVYSSDNNDDEEEDDEEKSDKGRKMQADHLHTGGFIPPPSN